MIGLFFETIFGSLWMPISINILIKGKVTRKNRVICLCSVFIVQIVASLIAGITGYSELGLIYQFPVIGLLVYCLMGRYWQNLIYIPVAYILIVICNYITEVLFILVLDLSVKQINKRIIYILLFYATITIAVVLFSILLQKIVNYAKNIYVSKSNKAMISLIGGNVLLCMAVFLINGWSARRLQYPDNIVKINLLLFAANAVFTIVLSSIVFHVYRERANMEHEKQEQENLQEYTKQVEKMYEGLRAFKHDYTNILATLSGYLDEEDFEGLRKYFDNYILPTNKKINQDNYRLIQLSNIKQSSIKGVLASKLIYAHTIGIEVYIDIVEEIKHINMNPVDFTRVLGIFLDNAIEASNECDIKEIKLNIIKEKKSVTIIIMNTFIDHGIPISQFEKKYFSTKGENRGIGLYNVREILNHYNNVFKVTEINNGFFSQTLIIENE